MLSLSYFYLCILLLLYNGNILLAYVSYNNRLYHYGNNELKHSSVIYPLHTSYNNIKLYSTKEPKNKKLTTSNIGIDMMDEILAQIDNNTITTSSNISTIGPISDSNNVIFPELEQSGITL